MLRAKDLWKQEDERKTTKMQAMKPVMSNLFGQIKTHAALNPTSPYFAFDVPSFVFGYPLYDHEEATAFVRDVLVEQGFQVWIAGTCTLVISWLKPTASKTTAFRPPPVVPDYRPQVYDPAAMNFLRSKINN